jgi:trehalose 6-phosphate synthase
MSTKDLVVVSDRGPVQFEKQDGELVLARRKGSLTAWLDGVARSVRADVTWVAPSTAPSDGHATELGLLDELSGVLGYRYQAVVVDERDYYRYYDDTGVKLIWTVWHDIEEDVPVQLLPLAGYQRVNRALADRVATVAPVGATVAVQDYQVLTAPALIRRRRDDLRIVHFSHTPFPSAAALDALPPAVVRELVLGMLGADLLGFQSPLWARRFLDSCARLELPVDHDRGWVGHDGRRVWVRCYPVLVDTAALEARASAPDVTRWANQIRAEDLRRMITRVDRLDPAKNVVRGFEAYALLLRRRPALADEIRFVACLVPSRARLTEYRHYADRMWRLVRELNDEFPNSVTVHYGDDHDRALGALRVHDVLLVNPVADGMNLVAQEGAVLNPDAATVLSTGAGCAHLLDGAVPLTEPKSVQATATALAEALALPVDQRRERARRMRAALGATDWIGHQLADVDAVHAGAAPCCPLDTDTRLPHSATR